MWHGSARKFGFSKAVRKHLDFNFYSSPLTSGGLFSTSCSFPPAALLREEVQTFPYFQEWIYTISTKEKVGCGVCIAVVAKEAVCVPEPLVNYGYSPGLLRK